MRGGAEEGEKVAARADEKVPLPVRGGIVRLKGEVRDEYIQVRGFQKVEIHFEKGRNLQGSDADPLEAQLLTGPNGTAVWTLRSLSDCEKDRVIDLLESGLSQHRVARELGISVGKVNKIAKEWKCGRKAA